MSSNWNITCTLELSSKITDVQEVNIAQVWPDLLINSVKWSERRGESEWTQQEKNPLKYFLWFASHAEKTEALHKTLSSLGALFFHWKVTHPFSNCNLWLFPFSYVFSCCCAIAGSVAWCYIGSGVHSRSGHHFWAVMTNASWHGQLHQPQPHHLSNVEVIRAWDCVRALIWKPKQL